MVFPSKSLRIKLLTYIHLNDFDELVAESAPFFSVRAGSFFVLGHLRSLELDSTAQVFMGAANNGELTLVFNVILGTQTEKNVERRSCLNFLKSLLSRSISTDWANGAV